MVEQKSISPKTWLHLCFLGLLWGGSFVAIEILLRQLPFQTLVAFRVGGASLILWTYILLMKIPVPKFGMTWIWFLIIGIENVALPFGLISWGQQHISSGLSSILNASTAIFGPLVAAIAFTDERLGARKALGVFLGFLGVSTVIGLESLHSFDLRSAGQLALIGAGLSYAIGAALARKFLTDIRPEVGAAGMLSGGAALMIPWSITQYGAPDVASYTAESWLSILYLAAISTALAYLLLFKVLKAAGSGNATLVTLFIAPFGVVLGALILSETLELRAYIGFGIIALGLMIIDGRLLTYLRRKTF
jgi:drug/metabolite transporter (DMT)-like permease